MLTIHCWGNKHLRVNVWINTLKPQLFVKTLRGCDWSICSFLSPPNFKKKAIVGGTRYLESNVAFVKKENKAYVNHWHLCFHKEWVLRETKKTATVKNTLIKKKMLWSPGMPKCSQLTALRKGGLALFLCVHSQKNVRREEPRWKRALWVSVPLAILNQRNLNGKCSQRGGVGGAGGGAELEVWHVRIREVYKGCIFLDTNVNINHSCRFFRSQKAFI